MHLIIWFKHAWHKIFSSDIWVGICAQTKRISRFLWEFRLIDRSWATGLSEWRICPCGHRIGRPLLSVQIGRARCISCRTGRLLIDLDCVSERPEVNNLFRYLLYSVFLTKKDLTCCRLRLRVCRGLWDQQSLVVHNCLEQALDQL